MDHRRYRHDWFEDFNEAIMRFRLKDYWADELGFDSVPAKYEVCDTCGGKGRYVNPNIDEHGLTSDDFTEDPDLMGNYLSGMYDVPCAECHGSRVSPTPDYDRLTKEQGDKLRSMIDDLYQEQLEDYMIRRAESGGYDW